MLARLPLRAAAAALRRTRAPPTRGLCADPAPHPPEPRQDDRPDPVAALPPVLRADARRLTSLLDTARTAAAAAEDVDADEESRVEARFHVRAAVLAYRALAARAQPAACTNAGTHAVAGSDKDADAPSAAAASAHALRFGVGGTPMRAADETAQRSGDDNAVARAFQADVNALKDSLSRANKPRVFFGWTGFF